MKPVIAITTGDPSGIGPEVSLKAALRPEVLAVCRPLLIGDRRHLLGEAARLPGGLPGVGAAPGAPAGWPEVSRSAFTEFGSKQGTESEIEPWSDGPAFHDMGALDALPDRRAPSAAGGRASVQYVKQAVGLVRSGAAAAIATAPISKTALRLAGIRTPGHTELLADLCGADPEDVAMMFVAPELKVALLTLHLPMADAIALLTRERVAARLRLMREEHLRWFGGEPRIGLCALNPHAGEEGMFGREEQEILSPAVTESRAAGVNVSGPHPADTLFVRAMRGEFDMVLALFHDQGTIAVKVRAFDRAVNMTLGLPLLRTSVDHGTAFDIAGRGKADPGSLAEAVLLAARLAPRIR